MTEKLIFRPQEGPQEQFLATPADVAIYGGAAGGGKSTALLLEPLRHINVPNFGSVTFRKTYPQITAPGALWDESAKIYSPLGGKPNKTEMYWKWPHNVRLRFAHMQHEKHMYDWQGSQITLINWDEITHFKMSQFFYMFSRNRSMCGVKPYIRGTCNPDPDSWVAEFISWWIDQDTGYAIDERSGVLRYFVRQNNEGILWADDIRDFPVSQRQDARSFTFIKAKVTDNKLMLDANPEYMASLRSLPLIERERLLNGNWKIKPTAGNLFNSSWYEVIQSYPTGGQLVRFWDFAATEKKLKNDDPDYTATILMLRVGQRYYILDCQTFRLGPADIDKIFVNLTSQDASLALQNQSEYSVGWEIEGGASGKRDSARLTTLVSGINSKGIKPQGDKITRAKPFAAQSEAGNVYLIAGAWNKEWLTHMHNQPNLPHDDIMDGTSGAFNALSTNAVSVIPNIWDLPNRES